MSLSETPKPKPVRVLPDGRPVYRFSIGRDKASARAYEIRPWKAGELAEAEIKVVQPYRDLLRKSPDLDPEGLKVDSQFTHMLACIVEPKDLSVKDIADMGREHYLALRTTIFKLLELDYQEDVFFPDSDEPNDSRVDADLSRVESQGGTKPPPKRVPILVRSDELAEGTTEQSVRRILGARPGSASGGNRE